MARKSGFRIGPAAAAPTWRDELRPAASRGLHGGPSRLKTGGQGAALAVHFRQTPELTHEVLEFLGALAQQSGLAVQEGKMVAELKQAHHDKGKGIAALLANPPFLGRKPVFIGDDLTDESGFLFVNAQGGVSVRVGPTCLVPSCAGTDL